MTHPRTKSALIVVDVQNDFLPGGKLAVSQGDKIIPLINKLVEMDFDCLIATKDWHPHNHGSFAASHGKKIGEVIDLNGLSQILWPVHCVQDTEGSEFAKNLHSDKFDKVFFKGTDVKVDSYSTFFDNGMRKSTGLDDYLKEKKITDLYFAGLATDYCVKYSVLDAASLGYNTHVIVDACRGVNLSPSDTTKALNEMKAAGAHLVKFADL